MTDDSSLVKAVQCTSCGASLTIRASGSTDVLACESCGSILDLTDDELAIIEEHNRQAITPVIPLGTRGVIREEEVEVIGYMHKRTTIEGIDYIWAEYLLFNPYLGFRWFTEYNGHWCYLKTVTDRPHKKSKHLHPHAVYDHREYKHFQQAIAKVIYVAGEFYWQVREGEQTEVSDYVAPPYILSEESRFAERSEVTWSAGEYVEPEEIKEGFGLSHPMPRKIGVGPSQVCPHQPPVKQVFKTLGLLAALVLVAQIVSMALSQNLLVFDDTYVYRAENQEKSLVTDVFNLSGRTCNVEIRLATTVENHWIYFNMALINEATGKAYDFGREVSYYHGSSGGERWSEGSQRDTAVLPTIPPGQYYLRIEPQSDAAMVRYTVSVLRDVPQWTYFFIALFVLCVPVVIHAIRRSMFEHKRWMDSDYPPISSDDE